MNELRMKLGSREELVEEARKWISENSAFVLERAEALCRTAELASGISKLLPEARVWIELPLLWDSVKVEGFWGTVWLALVVVVKNEEKRFTLELRFDGNHVKSWDLGWGKNVEIGEIAGKVRGIRPWRASR